MTTPDDDEHASPEPTHFQWLKGAIIEAILRLGAIESRLAYSERLSKSVADNLFILLQRSDPLTWQRRAAILALSTAFGSGFSVAVVHTLWLAYFR